MFEKLRGDFLATGFVCVHGNRRVHRRSAIGDDRWRCAGNERGNNQLPDQSSHVSLSSGDLEPIASDEFSLVPVL